MALAKEAAKWTVKLSNGVVQPLVGLGKLIDSRHSRLNSLSYQARGSAGTKREIFDTLKAALDVGYRYIDTAYAYGNEEAIGEFLESYFKDGKLKREDVFIATKLPFMSHKPEDAEETIKKQLAALRTDYIDLYLVHNACSVKKGPDGGFLKDKDGNNVFDTTPHRDTWKVLESFYKEKKLRAIGVSNFRADQLQRLYDQAEIKPMNLQVELHIFHRNRKLVDLVPQAGHLGHAGFGPGDYPDADCLGHPLVQELAKKYNKTPAQILLRHAIQQKISVIPKSSNPERIAANFDIFDFEISDEDMKRFDEIKEDVRLFSFSFAKGHPEYPPFEE
ncbi:Major sperm protein [Aphelenchoides fujianensis]|nr:Major sperm protein [Aphelenchoides fujianensis]